METVYILDAPFTIYIYFKYEQISISINLIIVVCGSDRKHLRTRLDEFRVGFQYYLNNQFQIHLSISVYWTKTLNCDRALVMSLKSFTSQIDDDSYASVRDTVLQTFPFLRVSSY